MSLLSYLNYICWSGLFDETLWLVLMKFPKPLTFKQLCCFDFCCTVGVFKLCILLGEKIVIWGLEGNDGNGFVFLCVVCNHSWKSGRS